jgi:hypothetical protein
MSQHRVRHGRTARVTSCRNLTLTTDPTGSVSAASAAAARAHPVAARAAGGAVLPRTVRRQPHRAAGGRDPALPGPVIGLVARFDPAYRSDAPECVPSDDTADEARS